MDIIIFFANFHINKEYKNWVDPGLYVIADSTYNCARNMFHAAKLSALHGFTKGVSVDVLYL